MSPAEPMGSIMKENINMGENTSTASKREGGKEKRERQQGREADAGNCGEERELAASMKDFAAPNWDYPPPLGSPSDEQRRQEERRGEKLKETGTEEREDIGKMKRESTSTRER